MKTIFKITAIVAFMFTTVAGMAKDLKHSLTASKDAQSFVFHMDTQSKETIVKLLDTEAKVVYFEKVKNEESYDKKFNISKLEDGLYTLRVENSLQVIKYTMDINSGLVEVIEVIENVKPVFREKENMVYVNLLNLNKESVDILVYDGSNRVVFTETITDKVLVEKTFNFKEAQIDNYIIAVKDSNGSYYKEISVN